MALTSTIVLATYVDRLLGKTGTTLDQNTILAGMSDIVNRFEVGSPERLVDMHVATAITSVPVTLHNVSPTIKVMKNGEQIVRRADYSHLGNSYSLKNDSGKTTYFYTVGNLLYITPFSAPNNSYVMEGLYYGVDGSTLTWPTKYMYPLALFCAADELFKDLSAELRLIITALASLSTPASLATEFAAVQTRLTADDVELANAQLQKLRAYIEEMSATDNHYAVSAQNATSRINNASMILAAYSVLKSRYLEYFGIAIAQKKEQ